MRYNQQWRQIYYNYLHVCLSLVTLHLKKILLRSKAQAPNQLIIINMLILKK